MQVCFGGLDRCLHSLWVGPCFALPKLLGGGGGELWGVSSSGGHNTREVMLGWDMDEVGMRERESEVNFNLCCCLSILYGMQSTI